ncbi:MAG: hypothetical protein V3U03_14255 [Myxococcota bacterium]
MSSASQPIVCQLDALSPSERSRRSDLAALIQSKATGADEFDAGFRIRLPDDPSLLQSALELILLERRCCPFLALDLSFEPDDGAVGLRVGGPPGVKEFLRDNGILGCARPVARDECC